MRPASTTLCPGWRPTRGMRPDTDPSLRPPQTPGMAINTSLATDAGHQLSGEWSFGKQRTVNPLTGPTRYNFLYSLKAGPAGGRLRRPSSRRQRHDGHRRTGLTLPHPGTGSIHGRPSFSPGVDRMER